MTQIAELSENREKHLGTCRGKFQPRGEKKNRRHRRLCSWAPASCHDRGRAGQPRSASALQTTPANHPADRLRRRPPEESGEGRKTAGAPVDACHALSSSRCPSPKIGGGAKWVKNKNPVGRWDVGTTDRILLLKIIKNILLINSELFLCLLHL